MSEKQAAEAASADEPTSKKAKVSSEEEPSTANNNSAVNEESKPTKSENGKHSGVVVLDGPGAEDEANSDEQYDDEEEDEENDQISLYLEEIGMIQNDIGNLNESASEEILKVEQKFNKLRKPHYEKRKQLIKNIPHFWAQTIFNHPSISSMLSSKEEEDCFKYLEDLDVEEFEDIKSGYTIKLKFSENPFFNNEFVVRELHQQGDKFWVLTSPLDYKDTEAGKRLRESIKNDREGPNNVQIRSFFNWFLDDNLVDSDEFTEIFKDQIFASPLDYYNHEFVSDEDDDDDDEDDDDDDVDDESEDEEGENGQSIEGEELGELEDIEGLEYEYGEEEDGEDFDEAEDEENEE